MKNKASWTTAFLVFFVAITGAESFGQTFDEKFEHWPSDLTLHGRIIIDNGLKDFDNVRPLLERVTKEKRIVTFCPKAARDENALLAVLHETTEGNQIEQFADLAKFKSALDSADVAVLTAKDADPDNLAAIVELGPQLKSFVNANKTLIVDSSIASRLGAHLFNPPSDQDSANEPTGMNLLPNCIIDLAFDSSERSKSELLTTIADHPRSVGLGIADQTMVALSGRKFVCFGEGRLTLLLAANDRQTSRVESIRPREPDANRAARRGQRPRPQDFVADLTEWRRDAIDRTLAPFPAKKPEKPFVKNGTLLIVGGGGMPDGLMERFVELAGGKEHARLVFVPCAESDDVGERQRTVEAWKRMGIKHATFIHTKDRNRSQNDKEFLAPLTDATGIWFGGGRQWNLADSYYGTTAHKLMKEVLHRGGVIGGSSAGASIQGRYLARATPVGNFRIMAPGYERGGLGFLSGVAIDQHFSQRGRHPDMTELVGRHPQLLGIGLDEATAIVVQKSKAEIVGRGRVHFYDRNIPVVSGQPDFTALPDGSKYDLATRKVLVDTRTEE